MGWYGGGEGASWLGWLGMGLMMLTFWGLLAAAIVWVVRSTGASRVGGHSQIRAAGPDPLQILDERFARGEVSEEEYERRRALLRTP